MRKLLLLTASILAISFVTVANAQNIDWKIFTEPFVTSAQAQEINWQKVGDALGRKPAVSGDVRRYGFPRSDLTVTLDGVTIKPAWRSAAGLHSSRWAAKDGDGRPRTS
jgi:hypothetical protein